MEHEGGVWGAQGPEEDGKRPALLTWTAPVVRGRNITTLDHVFCNRSKQVRVLLLRVDWQPVVYGLILAGAKARPSPLEPRVRTDTAKHRGDEHVLDP